MTLDELRQYKPQILEIAGKYGVTNIRVFGSTARGDARADSDIDLLVELTQPMGLAFFRVQREFSQILGHPVEMMTDRSVNKRLWPHIEKDLTSL